MTPIWVYWAQGWDQAPALAKECASSWEEKNPGYNLVRLTEENIRDYLDVSEEIENLLAGLRVQTKSDIYRLLLIQKHGGLWVDATLYCARPVSEWLHLTDEQPVALFHNPGPDRLVSNWFIAARPQSELIETWLDEFLGFFRSMPNPSTPTGMRKMIQKLLEKRWSRSVSSTLNWWGDYPHRRLSLTPYFAMHYCFNRLVLTNSDFATQANSVQQLESDLAHIVQFALAEKRSETQKIDLSEVPVHKLNWRKMPKDQSVAETLVKMSN